MIKTISVPEPCSQPWALMAPVTGGRYCESCSKTVTDFTVMTDAEIINYFAEKNNVCGRFSGPQLDRINLQLSRQNVKAWTGWRKWVMTASLLASTMFYKATGQTAPVTPKVEQLSSKDYSGGIDKGNVASLKHSGSEIEGRIVDDTCMPLPGATVRVVGTNIVLPTDTSGRFKLRLPKAATQFTVSYIGFETATVDIDSLQNGICDLKLAPQVISMNSVMVRSAGFTQRHTDLTGGGVWVTATKKHSWLWRMYYKYIRTPIHHIFYGSSTI